MKCQKCQQHEANVQMSVRVNGQSNQYYLCDECFQKEKQAVGGMKMNFQSFGFPFDELMKQMQAGQPQQSMKQAPPAEAGRGGGGILDQYGRNLSSLAGAGLIDPVIGRDKEVSRVIEILNRRNKNNPVLIGEPGVGKTAIAEGLASCIAEGRVPNKLLNKEVFVLDVASLVAGTGVRGQFEERVKQVISEVKERKNVLLFIDEIHQLVGAGSAEGSMDAGNILKPALARGELQLIGATTLKEYRQIEKDAALERRFQPVQVAEPTVEETVKILKGLQKHYEDYHQVSYTDEAINACASLSHRYIQDRFLPDKAIDLLDESGSKMNLTIDHTDTASLQEQLSNVMKQKEAALKKEAYEEAAKWRDEEAALEQQLAKGESSASHTPEVTAELIHSLIESKTGIPVGKLQQNEQEKIKHLEAHLTEKVIGQEAAVQKVAKAVRRSRAGLKAKNRPIGSFLFVGPTGVGKTELTKVLAEELFGSKEALVRLDMSEFMEKHSVSKLIGSPPGYVGFEEAGQLTEKVRRNPYSIILLDEIEKAHPDVQHMFLQIMEDGRLTDSQGRTVSFKETVIIMTSNAGAGRKNVTVGFDKRSEKSTTGILESLADYFKPEFLNRFDAIIEFDALGKEQLVHIVDLMIEELNDMLAEQDLSIEVQTEVKDKLAELGYSPQFGARPLRRVIQERIEDSIADLILDHPHAKRFEAVLEDDDIKIKAM